MINPDPRPIHRACFKCSQPGHYSKNFPLRANVPSSSSNVASRGRPPIKKFNARSVVYTRGCVHHVTTEGAEDDANVVLKMLLVNSHPASVLFDSGASHSFISDRYALSHDMSFDIMPTPLEVQTTGSR